MRQTPSARSRSAAASTPGRCLIRHPGTVGLHTLPTANAMRYCYEACGDDSTRRLLLLQCAAFLPLFRGAMSGRGQVGDVRIDRFEPSVMKKDFTPAAIF